MCYLLNQNFNNDILYRHDSMLFLNISFILLTLIIAQITFSLLSEGINSQFQKLLV